MGLKLPKGTDTLLTLVQKLCPVTAESLPLIIDLFPAVCCISVPAVISFLDVHPPTRWIIEDSFVVQYEPFARQVRIELLLVKTRG